MNQAGPISKDSDVFPPRYCQGCGAEIRAGTPDGLCPRCLLGLGLSLHPGEHPAVERKTYDADWISPGSEPHLLGDYELLEEVARGGMGIVYRARQVSLNRIVAVKILLFGQFASAEFVKRFHAEAEAVASLRHSNIVGIHAVGQHEHQHYFSMDYIEGTDLARLVQNQPLPARQAALLMKTVSEALEYAHGRGILHRDLKPSNVLVDLDGQPHLTDFGLARRVGVDSQITSTGQAVGSPAYMAPEQASPGRQGLGRKCDIYSLGAILYHLLTGRPPFVGESVEAILAQVLSGDILSPRKLNPGLPRDLETICLKCLEREPARRYATARELAEELGRFLQGEPIRSRPVSGLEKARRWGGRNPALSGLGALIVLLLAAFFAYTLISAGRIRREANRARLAEQQARTELWQSYLAQARAQRQTGQAGQRFASIDAIRHAAAIRPSIELRNEAVAALALPDVRPTYRAQYDGDGTTLMYSDTLERFAVQREGGEISVCMTSNDLELARLPATSHIPRWVAGFSPDEKLLAVSYEDDLNYVWDIATRKPIVGPLPGSVCAITPDGNEFVVAGLDATLNFYSLTAGELIHSFAVPEPLSGVSLQPGSHLIAGFRHGSSLAHLMEYPGGKERFAFKHPNGVGSLALSADGKSLAVGCRDKKIYVWDTHTGASRAVLEGHENNVVAVGFNHAGTLLASASWDNTFRLWDTASWKQMLFADGMSYEMKFGPDDRTLGHLQRGDNGEILEVSPSTEFHQLYVPPDANYEAWGVALSPDSRLLATAHSDGVALMDAATGANLAHLPIGYCRSVLFVPDGSALITSGATGLILWPFTITRHEGKDEFTVGERHSIQSGLPLMGATLGGEGRWTAAANQKAGEVLVCEVSHPENHFVLKGLPNVQFVSASADLHWLAAGTWNGEEVKVWNVSERRLECTLPIPGSADVAFSPDGKYLATGGSKYKVWETSSWRRLYEVPRQDTEAFAGSMVFSPDSRWLAVLDRNREIIIVEAATGNELVRLQPPRQHLINALCFDAAGSKLIALQADQSLQIWDLREVRRELKALGLDW